MAAYAVNAPQAVMVPARPQLASGVRLVGKLQESGFQDQQWLIERNGRFLQVSELIYRVAEQVDGIRDLTEIANRVTDATEWLVTDEHIRLLLSSKLVPLGLVATEGDNSQPVSVPEESAPRSALSMQLRARAIPGRVVQPVADALRILHRPTLMITLLLVALGAHAWLYLISGALTSSVTRVLYTPGLLPLVLLILIAGAFAHEFGHASALHYGGGRVRHMGVGLYLFYPAFYTDVTDSYRLGRWARVRTDMGGIYFHLLFNIGLIGLYAATGWAFLPFAVLLINFDSLYQMLPFVRLDGYWALADLTGVPDFYSMLVPFLASLSPKVSIGGQRLPQLRASAKRIFLVYAGLSIPLLGIMLAFGVYRLPSLAATAWDSVQVQLGAFRHAIDDANILAALLSLAQAVFLLLPPLAVVWVLYITMGAPVRAAWVWSRKTLVRRLAVIGVVGGAVAAIAVSSANQLSRSRVEPPTGVAIFAVSSRDHVTAPVTYAQDPPVGGEHAPVWQNCGFYTAPVKKENAVHSLEHGAVWITYRPDLSEIQTDFLRHLAEREPHVLVSAYPGLRAPVVASAWGRQLRLSSALDARLEQFVLAFRLGPQAPERGAPCSGGTGTPQ